MKRQALREKVRLTRKVNAIRKLRTEFFNLRKDILDLEEDIKFVSSFMWEPSQNG